MKKSRRRHAAINFDRKLREIRDTNMFTLPSSKNFMFTVGLPCRHCITIDCSNRTTADIRPVHVFTLVYPHTLFPCQKFPRQPHFLGGFLTRGARSCFAGTFRFNLRPVVRVHSCHVCRVRVLSIIYRFGTSVKRPFLACSPISASY